MKRLQNYYFSFLRPARAAVEAKGFTSGSGESMQLTGVLIVSDIEIIHLHEGDHEQCHHLCLEDSQCQRWIWNQDKDLCFLDAREDLRGVRMKSTKVESLKTGDRDTILMMEDKTAPAKVNRNKPTPKDKKTPKRPTKKPQPSRPHPKKKGTSPAPTATQKPKTNEEVVASKKKVVLKANRRPPPRPQPKRKTLLESDDEESVVIINMDSNVDASENIET